LFCGTQTQQTVDTRKPDWFPVIHAFRSPPPLLDPKKNNFLRIGQFSPPDPGTSNESEGVVFFSAQLGLHDTDNSRIRARQSPTAAAAAPTPRVSEAAAAAATPAATPAAVQPADVVILSPSEAAAAKERKFSELLRDGNQARINKDYGAARQLYLDAQKIGPDDYRAPEGLGDLYADQRDWNAAEQAYRDALKLRPDRSFLNLNLAYVMLQGMVASGNNSRAAEVEQMLQRALASNPRNPAAYELFEQFAESQNTAPSSLEPVFRAAVSYMPNSVNANLRLAHVLYQLGKQEEALDYVRRTETLVVDRSQIAAYRNVPASVVRRYLDLLLVAQGYQTGGNYKDAERIVSKALELYPGDPFGLYLLGSVRVQRRHFQEALIPLQNVYAQLPDNFAPVLMLGIAQLGDGNLAAAEANFDDAAAKVKDEADGIERLAYWFSALGDAYRSKGRLADAIRSYEKSLKHVADNPDTRASLLEVQRKYKSKSR